MFVCVVCSNNMFKKLNSTVKVKFVIVYNTFRQIEKHFGKMKIYSCISSY